MTLIIPISLVDSYCGRPFKTEENGHTLQDIAESEMVYHSASWYLRRARQRRMGHFIASDTVLDQGGSRGAGGTPPPLRWSIHLHIRFYICIYIYIFYIRFYILVHSLPRKSLYLPLRGGARWKEPYGMGILSTLKPKEYFHIKVPYICFLNWDQNIVSWVWCKFINHLRSTNSKIHVTNTSFYMFSACYNIPLSCVQLFTQRSPSPIPGIKIMPSVSTHQQHLVILNLFSLWGGNKDHQDQRLALEAHLLELDPLSPSDPNHSFQENYMEF